MEAPAPPTSGSPSSVAAGLRPASSAGCPHRRGAWRAPGSGPLTWRSRAHPVAAVHELLFSALRSMPVRQALMQINQILPERLRLTTNQIQLPTPHHSLR